MNEVGIAELPPEVKAEAAAEQSQSEDALPEVPTSEVASVEVPAPESPPALDSIPQWQQLLKRREKITKQDLGSLPAERTGQKVDVYSLSEEDLMAKVQEATGIGKKLAERVCQTIMDLKNMTADLQPGQRELLFPFDSAADLMIVPYVGMARANELAKVLGLEEAVKVEPFEPEYDEALGDDAGGFDDEPEFDEDTSVSQPQEKVLSLDDLEIKGVAMEAKGTVTREMATDNIAEKQDPKETRKKMFQAILDSVGASTATFFDKMDRAAGRALQSSGVGAMESVVNTAVNNMEKPWEYPADGAAENVQNEKSLFRRVLEKLPKLKLSEKQQTLLREKIAPAGAVIGGVAATALLTISLLTGGYGFQQSQAETIKGSLQVLTERATLDSDTVAQFESSTSAPVEDTLTNTQEPQSAVVPGILRDGGADWQSDAADVIASNADTTNQPEMLNSRWLKQKLPPENAETATQSVVPESLTTDQIIAAAEAVGVQQAPALDQPVSSETTMPQASEAKLFIPTQGESLNDTASTTEERTFIPSAGVTPLSPENNQAQAESEMSVLDDGVLDTECVNFLRALSKKEGTVYNPDGKNLCKLIIKYMNHRNQTDWSNNTAGISLTEIKSVDELNRAPDEGDIGIIPPDAVVAGLYMEGTNLESVEDAEVKSILEKIMTYQIKEDDMTDELLEKVLKYGFEHQVEPPKNY